MHRNRTTNTFTNLHVYVKLYVTCLFMEIKHNFGVQKLRLIYKEILRHFRRRTDSTNTKRRSLVESPEHERIYDFMFVRFRTSRRVSAWWRRVVEVTCTRVTISAEHARMPLPFTPNLKKVDSFSHKSREPFLFYAGNLFPKDLTIDQRGEIENQT